MYRYAAHFGACVRWYSIFSCFISRSNNEVWSFGSYNVNNIHCQANISSFHKSKLSQTATKNPCGEKKLFLQPKTERNKNLMTINHLEQMNDLFLKWQSHKLISHHHHFLHLNVDSNSSSFLHLSKRATTSPASIFCILWRAIDKKVIYPNLC